MRSVLLTVFIAAMVGTLAAILITPNPDSTGSATKRETVYERVMRTGVIRCGYVPYEPALVIDLATQEKTGFSYYIIEKIAENLSLKVDWAEEVSPPNMLEGLVSNRYDMICTPFWVTAERARVADYTIPFYRSLMGVWVRTEDDRFNGDIEKLNNAGYTLSSMDGTTIVKAAHQLFPKAKILGVAEMAPISDILVNVATGKADATVIDNYLVHDFNTHNNGVLKQIDQVENAPSYANAYLVPQGEEQFKNMLNAALTELLGTGYIDQQIDKFDKYPNTFKRIQTN